MYVLLVKKLIEINTNQFGPKITKRAIILKERINSFEY